MSCFWLLLYMEARWGPGMKASYVMYLILSYVFASIVTAAADCILRNCTETFWRAEGWVGYPRRSSRHLLWGRRQGRSGSPAPGGSRGTPTLPSPGNTCLRSISLLVGTCRCWCWSTRTRTSCASEGHCMNAVLPFEGMEMSTNESAETGSIQGEIVYSSVSWNVYI